MLQDNMLQQTKREVTLVSRDVIQSKKWTYDRMLFFPKLEYQQRRKKIWKAWKPKKAILLLGQQEEAEGQFVQWPTFEYFTGYREPGAVLILLPSGKSSFSSHLFIPPIDNKITLWEGNRFDPSFKQSKKYLGCDHVYSTQELGFFISRKLGKAKTVGTYFSVDRYNKELKKAPASVQLKKFLKKYDLKYESISYEVNEIRRIKSPLEIKYHTQADRITWNALQGVFANWKKYQNEYEIHGDIEGEFRRGGALEVAYAPIIASGFNASVLHYRNNDYKLGRNHVVLMDVGCRYRGYCADITRDYPRSGKFSRSQRKVYEAVLESQRRGIAAVRPGVTWDELNEVSWSYLKNAGFERLHGIGHFLGMDVHDVGDYKKPLEPGVLITIEPGVYLADEGIGIRIEDNVLVTKTGCKVISSMILKKVDDVERMLR